MPKKDAVVRTAQDLEKKYNFASLLGLKKNVEFSAQGIQKIENELNGMLNALVINLKDLLDSQSEISLWFYSGTPTKENSPYKDWETPTDHEGDFYYDQTAGKVYQFKNNVWELNISPDLIEAMAITNAEIDEKSHERKVFFDTPTIPYSNGDWWIKEDGTLYICQLSKTTGAYESNDFINSSKYTSSTAEKIGEEIAVLKGTITLISENYAKFTDLATGGSTTIAGENITTGNIQSNNYVFNTSGMKIALSNGTIDSKNFKTDEEGNVYLGEGAKVIGGDGLLTNLNFNSGGRFQGYDRLGFALLGQFSGTNSYGKSDISLDFSIPDNFTVVSAYVTLHHTPASWTYLQSGVWGYARNLKIYKAETNANYTFYMSFASTYELADSNLTLEEIPNAFGASTYQPTNTSGSTIEIKESIDIHEYISKGQNKIVIRTTDAIPTSESVACAKTGMATAFINIIGYTSFEGSE